MDDLLQAILMRNDKARAALRAVARARRLARKVEKIGRQIKGLQKGR